MRNTEHPWDFHHWETTKTWLNLIEDLYKDANAFGPDSPKFKKKLSYFFRKVLNQTL